MKALFLILIYTFCFYFVLFIINAKIDFSDLETARGLNLVKIILWDLVQVFITTGFAILLIVTILNRFDVKL